MKRAPYRPSSQDERISESGREQCATIEGQRRVVYDQMAAILQQENPQDEGDEKLDELIDNWAQAEVDEIAGLAAKTPFETLLKRHHDLGEDLMDVVAENLPDD